MNEINTTTGYYGPSTYLNIINIRDSYIIASLSCSLGIVEKLVQIKKVIAVPPVEVEVVVISPHITERDLPPLPRNGDVV